MPWMGCDGHWNCEQCQSVKRIIDFIGISYEDIDGYIDATDIMGAYLDSISEAHAINNAMNHGIPCKRCGNRNKDEICSCGYRKENQ